MTREESVCMDQAMGMCSSKTTCAPVFEVNSKANVTLRNVVRINIKDVEA